MRGFWKNRRGAVSVLGALSLVSLIGASALAVDIGRGLEQRVENQRVADVAALAAALSYMKNNDAAQLLPVARSMVAANGIEDATVTAVLETEDSKKIVRVTVTTPMPVLLGRIFGGGAEFPVGAGASALVGGEQTVASCIMGLASSGNAVETSGGATITANDCAVSGVGNVYNGGTGIYAKQIVSGSGSVGNNYGTLRADLISYATAFNNPSWNANVPSSDKRVQQTMAITDPLGSDTNLVAARSLLGSYVTPRTLSNPVTPSGANWAIGWSPSSNVVAYRQGTSGTYIVPAGNYTIGRLTVDGGITLTFQPGSNVTIANGVSIGGGSTVTFGDGNWKINGGFSSGSNGVTFGNGSLYIGSGTVTFNGTNRIGDGPVSINAALQIGGGTSLRMGAGAHGFGSVSVGGGGWLWMGNGDLDVTSGVSVDGDSTIASGLGDVRLGKNSSGNAIYLSGSGRFLMMDGAFSANGNIVTSGGSRLVFGKTANHLINGNMTIAGGVLFGAGRYTINGNFVNGTGGAQWPYTWYVNGVTYGTTLEGVDVTGYDQAGVNVTFIMAGTLNLSGGAKTKLIAPTTTTSGGALADILLDSLTSAATTWSAGSQNVFVGAVHLPNSTVTMSGGNTTSSGAGCFMLIANRIVASGGAMAGTACQSIVGGSGTSGSSNVSLVR